MIVKEKIYGERQAFVAESMYMGTLGEPGKWDSS